MMPIPCQSSTDNQVSQCKYQVFGSHFFSVDSLEVDCNVRIKHYDNNGSKWHLRNANKATGGRTATVTNPPSIYSQSTYQLSNESSNSLAPSRSNQHEKIYKSSPASLSPKNEYTDNTSSIELHLSSSNFKKKTNGCNRPNWENNWFKAGNSPSSIESAKMTQAITPHNPTTQPSHCLHSNKRHCRQVVMNHESIELISQDTSNSKNITCNAKDLLNDGACSGRSNNSQCDDKELHISRNCSRDDARYLNTSLHTSQTLPDENFGKESMINCAEVLSIYSGAQDASLKVKNDGKFLYNEHKVEKEENVCPRRSSDGVEYREKYEKQPSQPDKIKRKRGRPKGSVKLGMPTRPLSAYNIFFKEERAKVVAGADEKGPHRKVSFENLARTVGKKWRTVDSVQMEYYKALAFKEKERYHVELKIFHAKKNEVK